MNTSHIKSKYNPSFTVLDKKRWPNNPLGIGITLKVKSEENYSSRPVVFWIVKVQRKV